MAIPAGTKFHGVASSVETENKGSAQVNALRNVYTIEEIIAETASSDAVQLFERTLTPAEVLSFNGGGTLELIAAPGANKVIVVLNTFAFTDFNSVAYDSTQSFFISYGDSNYLSLPGTYSFIGSSALNATSDSLQYNPQIAFISAPFINEPVKLYSGATQSITTGDSPVKIALWYKILNLS